MCPLPSMYMRCTMLMSYNGKCYLEPIAHRNSPGFPLLTSCTPPPPSPSMEKPLAPMVAHGHVAALLYNTLDAGRQARTHISFSHTTVFTLFSGIWRSSSFIANSLRSQSWFSFLKYPLHSRITLLPLYTRLEIHMCIIKQFTRPQWHRT